MKPKNKRAEELLAKIISRLTTVKQEKNNIIYRIFKAIIGNEKGGIYVRRIR